MTWTPEQIRQCAESMDEALTKEEADRMTDGLWAELGEEGFSDLVCSPEVDYARAQIKLAREAKATLAKVAEREQKRAKRKLKPVRRAKRVSVSPETWRILDNYPNYQISNRGRVRALDRATPEDWLKPRRRWLKGLCVEYIVLRDKDGKRRERMIGYLLISAGFMDRPKWMKDAS